MRFFLPALLLLSLGPGCARMQSFRVVDAETGEPIDGVRAEQLHSHVRMSSVPLVLVQELTPVEHEVTDDSGRVSFKAGSQFAINPLSDNPGYSSAYVAKTWLGTRIRYPNECREVAAKTTDGVVEIPLRKGSPLKHESPSKRL